MTESIWVLRDPSGKILGCAPEGDEMLVEELHDLAKETNGFYTLALEPHARPEGVADV